MKIKNEIKIGIVVVIAIILLVYGYNFLKGTDLLSVQRNFYAVYENIGGLTTDNPVQINGYNIGRVNDITFHPDNSGKIIVSFSITDSDFPIPKNTIADLVSLDLLGSKAIELKLGNSVVYLEGGDTLITSTQATLQDAVNEQVRPLKEKAEGLIASIDSVVTIIQAVLNQDARDNLSKSFISIKKAIGTFEVIALRLDTLVGDEKTRIHNILLNLQSIVSNFEKNNEQLGKAIQNISAITDSISKSNLTQAINNTSNVMNNMSGILEKINKGEGTIGLLVNDDSLYNNLESTSLQLSKVLEDIRLNPGRYVHLSVFGKKEKKNKKGSKP